MARRVRKSRADNQRWNQMVSSLRMMNMAFTHVRLYPPTHPEVVSILGQIHQTIQPIVEEMEDIGYGFMDEMLYLEGAMSLEETANNQMLVDRFTKCRVKYLIFMKGISTDDLAAFFQVLNAEATKPSEESPGEILEKKGIRTVHIVQADLDESAHKGKMARKKTALDWYEKAVTTLQSVQEQICQGTQADLKPLFRVIEDMTATIRNKGFEPYLLLPILGQGLNLDPHACHSVNVAIYCCALGNVYGLNSGEINSLCSYAFLHDIGRQTVPLDWAAQKKVLTDAERTQVDEHGKWGCLWLLCREDLPLQAALLALRHHLSHVGNALKDESSRETAPEGVSPPAANDDYAPDIFHKILSLADDYDLASLGEKYYWKKHRADRMLKLLLNRRGQKHDATLVKLLANCIGFYPVGSHVLLEDGQKAVVVRPNSSHSARPKVYLYEAPVENIPPSAASAEQTGQPAGQIQPEVPQEPPPNIMDLTQADQTGLRFKNSITAILQSAPDQDIRKILDQKKDYLLSYSY